MLALGIITLVLITCFGAVLLFGPPYLPTLTPQVGWALDMADLQPGGQLLELGCGDGKVLLAAARRGYRVVGYELNPLLVLVSWLRTWRYRQLVRVRWGNYLTQPWPEADAIFVFGLQRIMPVLDKKIMQSIGKPVNVVSFAFTFPNRAVRRHRQGLRLYRFAPPPA